MEDSLKLEWVSEGELSESAKRQIEELNQVFFPENLVGGRYRFGVKLENPHRLLMWEGDKLLGQLIGVERQVSLDHTHLHILFVGEFCVRQEQQGKGLGKKLLSSLDPHISKEIDASLLCCRKELLGFYEKVGWTLLPIQVFFGPTESISRCAEGIIMAKMLTSQAKTTLTTPGGSLYLGESV